MTTDFFKENPHQMEQKKNKTENKQRNQKQSFKKKNNFLIYKSDKLTVG